MNKVFFSLIIVLSLFVSMSKTYSNKTSKKYFYRKENRIDPGYPPCVQMYMSIEKYADSFNIPKQYAYGIAYKETKYQGPFHWKYNHKLSSTAGAVGPMQVMVGTARGINKDGVDRSRLMTDIEYNVMTSMKLIRRLYNLRGSWAIALGEYNTGRPCINGYARDILNHKTNWKRY